MIWALGTLWLQIDARVSLQTRRRSERKGLGSFTDNGGARAAAMARRPMLQIGGKCGEGTGRRESLVLSEGGCGGALGSLI
jgi:hypothetical protein